MSKWLRAVQLAALCVLGVCVGSLLHADPCFTDHLCAENAKCSGIVKGCALKGGNFTNCEDGGSGNVCCFYTDTAHEYTCYGTLVVGGGECSRVVHSCYSK